MQERFFIFDMDGVLVDSEPVHKKILQEVFARLGLSLPAPYHDSLTGMAPVPLWEKIAHDYQLSQSPEALLALHKNIFFELMPQYEISEVPGATDLVKRLYHKGFPLAIASSSPPELIALFTEKLQIRSYFAQVVSGATLKRSKPFPDIFLRAAELLGASPAQCIVIEDSHNGVLAAKRAGMYCIGLQNPHSGTQDLSLADMQVKALSEIIF